MDKIQESTFKGQIWLDFSGLDQICFRCQASKIFFWAFWNPQGKSEIYWKIDLNKTFIGCVMSGIYGIQMYRYKPSFNISVDCQWRLGRPIPISLHNWHGSTKTKRYGSTKTSLTVHIVRIKNVKEFQSYAWCTCLNICSCFVQCSHKAHVTYKMLIRTCKCLHRFL